MANVAAKKIANQATVSQHSDDTSTEAVVPPVPIVPDAQMTQRTQLAQPQQNQRRYNLRSTTAESDEKRAVESLPETREASASVELIENRKLK